MKAKLKQPFIDNRRTSELFAVQRMELNQLGSSGTLLTTKDIARVMQLHPRSVKRWWRRLKTPPTIHGHSSTRWTIQQARKLIKRWQKHSAVSGHVLNWNNGRAKMPR